MGAELNSPPPGGAAQAPPASSAPLAGQWHGAGLTELIERLRAAGFRAGAAEAVSAGRLLTRLAAQPNAPTRRADLLPWLRPVFCSTREEQARFDAVFIEWARRFGMAWQPQVATSAAAAPETAAARAGPGAWGARRRLTLVVLGAGLALAAAIAAYVVMNRGTPAVDGPALPASQASAPTTPASAASTATAAAATRGPALQGLFAAQRESRSLRPERVWPLLAAPVLLWLLISGLPSLQLMQGRRRSGRRVVLDTRTLADEARQSLPMLTPAVAGRLERHVRADSGEGAPLARRRRLDARRTVEATLRNHGLLSLRYRLAPLRPSYLMLIDAHNEHDPRGRLFYLWAERLKREGLSVDIRLFRPGVGADDAPLCWHGAPAAATASGQALDTLFDPPPGQRLVVISEATSWLHADGAWQKWFERARLSRWPQRVFFTPTELRDWGLAEEAVERPEHAADPGFLTLPLDEAALDAWSVLLANGSLPAFSLAEPQRFPRVLAAPGFDPFSVPAPAEVDRLIAQLKLYLGDSGFRWLAALAVPPLVRWELTLLLGRALFDHRAALIGERWRDVLGRSYRRLARLPWLRGGVDAHGAHHAPALPDWLRLRLLDELPPDAQAEIRGVVDRLLSRLRPEAGGELPIDLEAPPADTPGHGGARGSDGDALYLGYLSGLTPRQLALRLPGGWSDWLRRERLAQPGWSARAARGALHTREWLRAKLARLAFRDGMPWSQRRLLPLALSAGLLLAAALAIGVLARWPAGRLPAAIDAAFFERRSRAVELPNVPNPRAIAVSPDGAHALAWGENAPLQLWSTTTGRVLQEFKGGRDALSARFDAAGTHVLACDAGGVVRAWPLAGGAATLIGGASTDPARRYLDCQIGADGRVRLLQPPGGDVRLLVSPDAPQGLRLADTAAALLSPNGRWVLRAAADGDRTQLRLSVWNVAAARAEPGEFSGEAAWIDWAGDTLASLVREGGSHSLVLRDLQRGGFFSLAIDDDSAPKQAAEAPQPYALALSADARYAVIGDTAGGVALWDIETRQRIDRRLVHPGRRAIAALRLSSAGDVLLSSSVDGDWRLSRAWEPGLALARSDDDVLQARISADGRRVAFAYLDGRVVLRDVDDPAQTTTLEGLEAQEHLMLSADGRRLAQVDTRGQVRLWAAPGMQPPVDMNTGEVFGPPVMGFDASGSWFRWLQTDGKLLERMVDSTAREAPVPVDTGGPISAAARSRDGLIAATGSSGAEVRLIEPEPGRPVRRLSTAPGSSPSVHFSNRGRTLWVARIGPAGPSAQAWDVASGTRLGEALTLKDSDYSSGSRLEADDLHQRLAAVAADGTLTVYDAASGRAVDTPPSGRKDVNEARWLPDGRLLITDRSGAASLWTLPVGPDTTARPTAALDLGGDPQPVDLSADNSRLLAVVLRRTGAPLVRNATPAAPNLLAIANADTGANAPPPANPNVENLKLKQAAAPARATPKKAGGTSASAPNSLPPPAALAVVTPGAPWRTVATAGLWPLPSDTPSTAPPGWLGERGGPHPLLLALAGLALAAGLVVLNLRRAQRRLVLRGVGPRAAESTAPAMTTEAAA